MISGEFELSAVADMHSFFNVLWKFKTSVIASGCKFLGKILCSLIFIWLY